MPRSKNMELFEVDKEFQRLYDESPAAKLLEDRFKQRNASSGKQKSDAISAKLTPMARIFHRMKQKCHEQTGLDVDDTSGFVSPVKALTPVLVQIDNVHHSNNFSNKSFDRKSCLLSPSNSEDPENQYSFGKSKRVSWPDSPAVDLQDKVNKSDENEKDTLSFSIKDPKIDSEIECVSSDSDADDRSLSDEVDKILTRLKTPKKSQNSDKNTAVGNKHAPSTNKANNVEEVLSVENTCIDEGSCSEDNDESEIEVEKEKQDDSSGVVTDSDTADEVLKKIGPQKKQEIVLESWIIKVTAGVVRLEGHRPAYEEKVFWQSSAIVKRLSSRLLETASGTRYRIKGSIDKCAMEDPAFRQKLCSAFQHGFPKNWKHVLDRHLSSVKHEKDMKKEVKSIKRVPPKQRRKLNESYNPFLNGVNETGTEEDPFILERLPRTRSGRTVIPQLAWWANQRVYVDPSSHEVTVLAATPTRDSDEQIPCIVTDKEKHSARNKVSSVEKEMIMGRKKHKKSQSSVRKQSVISKKLIESTIVPSWFGTPEISLENVLNVSRRTPKMLLQKALDNIPSVERNQLLKSNADEHGTLSNASSGSTRRPKRPKQSQKQFTDSENESTQLRRKVKQKVDDSKNRLQQISDDGNLLNHRSIKTSRNINHKDSVRSVKKATSDHENNAKKSFPQKPAKEPQEKRPWTSTEITRYEEARQELPSSAPWLWDALAKAVGTRSVEECREFHFQDAPPIAIKKKHKVKSSDEVLMPSQITGGVGTLKRKRQLREFVENHEKDHADDFCSSTPYRNLKEVKIPRLSSSKDMADFLTPAAKPGRGTSRHSADMLDTPCNPIQVPMPVSLMKTPKSVADNPEFPDSKDRREKEHYVHKLKKGNRHKCWGTRTSKKSSSKMSKPHQIKNLRDELPSKLFDLSSAASEEEEEDSAAGDYYFSESD